MNSIEIMWAQGSPGFGFPWGDIVGGHDFGRILGRVVTCMWGNKTSVGSTCLLVLVFSSFRLTIVVHFFVLRRMHRSWLGAGIFPLSGSLNSGDGDACG